MLCGIGTVRPRWPVKKLASLAEFDVQVANDLCIDLAYCCTSQMQPIDQILMNSVSPSNLHGASICCITATNFQNDKKYYE
jgi:hypothetical protein